MQKYFLNGSRRHRAGSVVSRHLASGLHRNNETAKQFFIFPVSSSIFEWKVQFFRTPWSTWKCQISMKFLISELPLGPRIDFHQKKNCSLQTFPGWPNSEIHTQLLNQNFWQSSFVQNDKRAWKWEHFDFNCETSPKSFRPSRSSKIWDEFQRGHPWNALQKPNDPAADDECKSAAFENLRIACHVHMASRVSKPFSSRRNLPRKFLKMQNTNLQSCLMKVAWFSGFEVLDFRIAEALQSVAKRFTRQACTRKTSVAATLLLVEPVPILGRKPWSRIMSTGHASNRPLTLKGCCSPVAVSFIGPKETAV